MTASGGDVGYAAAVLRRGGLVAFPTETVYGLGADALDIAAVRRIFEVKGRPTSHPLIVHLARADAIGAWAVEVPDAAEVLAEALWPGPLTLLVPRAAHVPDALTGGHPTVGLRVPDHPLALALLQAVDRGIAAPSANRFGRVSPTTATHVLADLGDAVDYVLDGGPCELGVESTIVDVTTDPPTLLRPGGVPVEALERVLGRELVRAADGPSRAPGMMTSHYAPRCAVEVTADRASAEARVAALVATGRRADLLDPAGDVNGYAHDLYAQLRSADDRRLDMLVAVLPSEQGLGRAVRDRLLKAAAPRPTAEDAG